MVGCYEAVWAVRQGWWKPFADEQPKRSFAARAPLFVTGSRSSLRPRL